MGLFLMFKEPEMPDGQVQVFGPMAMR